MPGVISYQYIPGLLFQSLKCISEKFIVKLLNIRPTPRVFVRTV